MELLSELQARGLVHQGTDLAGLERHLEIPRKIYCGFDPTAPSLTIGNLIPIVILSRFQRCGHTPVIVVGGATGLIGDPSGKDSERPMLDAGAVEANMNAQRRIFEAILDFSPRSPNRAVIVDNAEWIAELSYIAVLREIGKFFSINQMIQRESVRQRIDREQGISYTEFSYMLLQALDFKHLHEHREVTVQLGGSDQWGNIVSGVDLVRRTSQSQVFGLTCPLITRADGGKFGKTEAGPIWLSTDRTSPYALYQFFFNTADADVPRFLRMFTFMDLDQIEKLEHATTANPAARLAHRALAREVTTLVHGPEAAQEAEAATQALFTGDLSRLSLEVIRDVAAGVPTTRHASGTFPDDGLAAVDLLCLATPCPSKREARRWLDAGAMTLNGRGLEASDVITRDQLMHGGIAVLRRGKKNWFIGIWE